MYKKILIMLSCLSIPFLQAHENNSLIVGTNSEFPPFSFMENKLLVGFDIDIAHEVAQRIGKTILFKDMPFEALIPAVNLGHVDFVAAGMSYTEERAKRVLFTKPYHAQDPFVILSVSKQKINFDNCEGKTFVVVEGFTADHLMSSKSGINLIRLPTQADGFMAIKSGRADGFVTAKSTVDTFFKIQDASQYHLTVLEGTGETYALIVPKNKTEMLKMIQNALDEMENDGTMTKLKTKWKLQ